MGRKKSWSWAASGLELMLLLGGCSQQPYRVFAVQIAAAQPAVDGAASEAVAQLAPEDQANRKRPRDNRERAVKPELVPQHPHWGLNEADAKLLASLPGIQAATVRAIVAGRPYRTKRDLLKRKVLTAAEYARWKDYLVVHRSSLSRSMTSKPSMTSSTQPRLKGSPGLPSSPGPPSPLSAHPEPGGGL